MSKEKPRPPLAKRRAKADTQFKRWREEPVPALDTPDVAGRIGEALVQHARPARKSPNDGQ